MKLAGLSRRIRRRRLSGAASLWAILTICAGAPSAAFAGDWSLEANYGEQIDIYDNYLASSESDGWVLSSTTNARGNFIYRTPNSRFDAIADIVAKGYIGPGSEDLSNAVLPRFSTRYYKAGKTTDVTIGANYAFEYLPDIEETELTDADVNSDDAYRHSFSANTSVVHKVNFTNTLTFLGSASQNTYVGEGTDSSSVGGTIRWDRRLTKRTDAYVSTGVRLLSQDDEQETERFIYSGDLGFSSQLTKRLTTSLGLGFNLVHTHRTEDPGNNRKSDLTPGFSVDTSFQYTLKTLILAGSASYGLEDNSLGGIENRASAALSLTKYINDRSSVAVSIRGQVSQSFEDDSTGVGSVSGNGTNWGLAVSPTYNRSLTDEWNFRAGYSFRLEESGEGPGISNRVFIALSRSFVPMP